MTDIRISIVKSATDTKTLDFDVNEIIKITRTGGKNIRRQIEAIRKTWRSELDAHGDYRRAKKAIDPAKKRLPGVMWSGTFTTRAKDAKDPLINYSGLLCADLDHLGEQLQDAFAKLSRSPHVWALFRSPSADGLKAVFRVPADASKHRGSFRAVDRYVKELVAVQIDESCKDVARLCFLSYDPQIFHNPKAVEIEPLPEPERPRSVNGTRVDLTARQRIAAEMLGSIAWQSETSGVITCPGKHLHTTGDGDRDCKLDLDQVPTVHCFHNSCRGILDGVNHVMRSRIGKTEFTARDQGSRDEDRVNGRTQKKKELPRLSAEDHNLGRISDAALKILVESNEPPYIFRRAESISRLALEDNGAAAIRPMSEASLRGILGRIIWWFAIKKEEIVTAYPPQYVVEDILANPAPPFPVVTRVVRAPIFAPDGTLVTKPGYNAIAKIYYDPGPAFDVKPVPNKPTPEHVKLAKEQIGDILVDFPFVGDAERAHAIGLIVQPFARELIEGPTPLYLVEKPSPGTGAGLFVDSVTTLFHGRSAAVMTEGRDEEEWRKRIMAKLVSDNTVILIDNVRKRLESSALSAALTAFPVFEDRRLGKTETVGIAVRATWIATGNNPSLSNEMARRAVRIRLDAKLDQPWLRDGFKHPNLREYVAKERASLVWCALVLIQDWLVKGRPEPKAKPLGSFESWTRVIGGIVENAGFEGFLGNLTELYEQSDAEGAALRAFVAAWWDKYESNEVTVGQLYRIVDPEPVTQLDGITQDDPIDLDLGRGRTEQSRKIKLGLLLTANRDRQFDGKRILQFGKYRRATLWKLEPAKAEGSVSV